MSQTDFIKVKAGEARVIIKSGKRVEANAPEFELDMVFTVKNATQLLIYAMQLKDSEEKGK